MGGLSSFRASDADREQAAERLRHATAEGRLTADELDERLEALFGSRTYGELDALLADLPATRPPRPRAARAGLPLWVGVAGATALLLAVLGLLAGAGDHTRDALPRRATGSTFALPNPPVPQSHHVMIAAASRLTVVVLLAVSAALAWLFLRLRRASDA